MAGAVAGVEMARALAGVEVNVISLVEKPYIRTCRGRLISLAILVDVGKIGHLRPMRLCARERFVSNW